MYDIDEILLVRNRTLRMFPGKLLLGSTGARLWADYLDPLPGFQGRIDFIHKLNIPLLFSVTCDGLPKELLPLDTVWRPSMLEMKWQDKTISFREHKFITWDDIAVSVQRWENHSLSEFKLSLNLPEGFAAAGGDVFGETFIKGHIPVSIHKIEPLCLLYCPEPLRTGTYNLKAGEKIEFIIAMALGNKATDNFKEMEARLVSIAALKEKPDECIERQKREYRQWFKEIPLFESSMPLLDKTYWYRWFILRHNLARPGFGNFNHTLFYEGRSHKNIKDIFKPSGWEFSKLIPLSTPLHLTDSRWYGDAELSREALRSLVDSMDEEGLFRVLFTDEYGKEYANFSAWALYRFYLVHNDISFVREVLENFKKYTMAVYDAHKTSNDHLQIETTHALTGKEYQPSYWYFYNYPDDAKDSSTYTPLKRVDRSIYTYLNVLGIAKLCGITGDQDKAEFFSLAEKIRRDILDKMWEEKSSFFYDLHYQTDEKAPVKNIVGIYPLWADIAEAEHCKALEHLFDPDVFNTGCIFASTGKDCPVFSAEGGWNRIFFKGRNGCMWNGPSWPYTTAIAIDAIAVQSKKHKLGLDSQFMEMLKAYTLQHYQGRDMDKPYLVEFYNSITGEAVSDEADYNHSYYIDLIISHIAGIEPVEGGFNFLPCLSGPDSFSLKNVKIQGHIIDICYTGNTDEKSGKESGIKVFVDGREVYASMELPKNAIAFKFSDYL